MPWAHISHSAYIAVILKSSDLCSVKGRMAKPQTPHSNLNYNVQVLLTVSAAWWVGLQHCQQAGSAAVVLAGPGGTHLSSWQCLQGSRSMRVQRPHRPVPSKERLLSYLVQDGPELD